MRNPKNLARLLFVLLLLEANLLRADGLMRDGIGAISTGRGGTNMGFADNGAIIYDNPAAMVNIESGALLDVGIDTVICHLHYTDQDPNNAYGSTRPLPLPEIAYMETDGEWAWGIGVFAPAGFGANFHLNNPVQGPDTRYMSIGALGKILPSIAYRVTDNLSIGGTFGLGISYAELNGPLTVQTGPLTGAPSDLLVQGTGFTPVGSFGMQYLLTDNTTLGVCYQSESRFTLRGSADADIFLPGPTVVSSHFDAKTGLVWPRSLAFGVKHDLCPHRRIAADVIWYDWSHAMNRINMQFTNATNPIVPQMLGPVVTDSLPAFWHDSVSLRLGYEFEPDDESICRVGYVYHNSPVPANTLNPYIGAILEHAFSVGYTRRYQGVLLNAAYQFSFSPRNSVGTSAFVGGDFDNSTFTAQAHWASLGMTVPF